MRPDGYIFDLFGTLVPLPASASARIELDACARELGIDPPRFASAWNESYWARNLGDWASDLAGYLRVLIGRMGVQADDEAVARAVEGRRRFARSLLSVPPETHHVLDQLRAAGCRLAVLSVCGPAVAEVWSDSPLGSLVDVVHLSCVTRLPKTDPQSYLRVCQELGVSPHLAYFVGDGAGGELDGAAKAGLVPILLDSPASAAVGFRPLSWVGRRVFSLSELLHD